MTMQGENRTGAILVVGSGVAGLQAAVDLAASGCRVYVIDRAPLLGGLMPQLDKTFPTNDCAMCLIAPKEEDRSGCLRGGVAVGRHPNIRVMPNTELQRLDGEAGNFRAGLLTRPRFIDPSRCTACGKCTEVCPESAINEFNAGLDRRAAAYLPFPQAVPHVFAIDRTACTDCGLCVEACPVAAVNFGEQPEERELHVAAVVLAPGNEVFHPAAMKQYLYGLHPNVITSLEYERLYSGTGPHLGQLQRPSDRTPPKKIAWLQCIGSRDIHSHTYCSSVCCMYAIKEALIAKERLPEGVDAAIFYMDMRVCGKDYEQYYQRAREAYGVRFLCYRVPSIAPGADGDLTIEYFDADGQKQAELFNMVVLSVGFQVSAPARELAARLGIHLDRHAYPITDPCLPVASSRPGVYVCGAFQAPKDIPESVTEASAAAACCRAILPADSRTRMPDAPQASSPAAGSRRLGIFFCGCGPDLVEQLDMAELQNYAATLPGVVVAAGLPLDCAPASLADLAKIAAAERLDRAVVAACHPVMQDPEIIEAFRKAGLNRYLVEVVNLRGEVAWVHPDDKDRATAKARDLLRRAAARMLSLHPLPEKTLPLEQSALVLGGGVAGLNAALNLAQQGFGVFLLEKDKVLGGVADRLHRTIEGVDVKAYLDKLIAEVTSHEGI
ncbi:MAG: CoB--CoM heterodisulfide reductase iron-sulfur subunit A family protein, partial [Deltaproteobacteria bacterium]|nr:CoB--CoM heterodisulfide reductase iron-sulfur subunit A family protein [Deltaproteobacteria bacterium]